MRFDLRPARKYKFGSLENNKLELLRHMLRIRILRKNQLVAERASRSRRLPAIPKAKTEG
jgi:hypothetical protein